MIENTRLGQDTSTSMAICSCCSATSSSCMISGFGGLSETTSPLAILSRILCCQSCTLSTGPPSILTTLSSAGLPRTVPWYRDSSPVLLCFFLSAVTLLISECCCCQLVNSTYQSSSLPQQQYQCPQVQLQARHQRLSESLCSGRS